MAALDVPSTCTDSSDASTAVSGALSAVISVSTTAGEAVSLVAELVVAR